MKISKLIVLVLLAVSILALTVASQISQVSDSVNVEEQKTCETTPYGVCTVYYNYTLCLNTTGPNTDCSLSLGERNYSCPIEQSTAQKNLTACKSLDKFTVTITKGSKVQRKEIDFSTWGPCIHNRENDCEIITCVSKYDGASNGKFTDCRGGKSCQRFQICESGIKVYYKNSREEFVEEDPTFYLGKLALQEVGE